MSEFLQKKENVNYLDGNAEKLLTITVKKRTTKDSWRSRSQQHLGSGSGSVAFTCEINLALNLGKKNDSPWFNISVHSR